MRFLRWHVALILFWIIFEISFLQIVFPNVQAPLVSLALLVSLGMVFPLDRALGLTLVTAFLFEIIRAGALTSFFFLALPIVLITSFVSERFFPESRSFVRPQALIFFVGVVILYEALLSSLAWSSLWDILLSVLLFPMIFFSVQRLEEWLVSSSMLEFRSLRQSQK